MSCLQSLIYNPFNSKSSLVFQIKSHIYFLNQSNRLIHLIWIPSHISIHDGNEIADGFAKATSNIILSPLAQLPWINFTPSLRRYITNLWFNHWNNLPAYFAYNYKTIVPIVSNKNRPTKMTALIDGSLATSWPCIQTWLKWFSPLYSTHNENRLWHFSFTFWLSFLIF